MAGLMLMFIKYNRVPTRGTPTAVLFIFNQLTSDLYFCNIVKKYAIPRRAYPLWVPASLGTFQHKQPQ